MGSKIETVLKVLSIIAMLLTQVLYILCTDVSIVRGDETSYWSTEIEVLEPGFSGPQADTGQYAVGEHTITANVKNTGMDEVTNVNVSCTIWTGSVNNHKGDFL